MQIHIGATLARLRREKGLTQEAVADAVGVSAPAVSKWETGQSYPDITLLAPLARFFETTVDALLSYTKTLTDAERDAFGEELNSVFAKEGWEAGASRCEALLREYPRDAKLAITAFFTLMQGGLFADEAQRGAGYALQEKWMKDAMGYAQGSDLLYVKHVLGIFYMGRQRLDEAEALLSQFLDMNFNVRKLMPTLRMLQERYEEAEKLGQQTLLEAMGDVTSALATLANLAVKQGDAAQAKAYADAAEQILVAAQAGGFLAMGVAQARWSMAKAFEDGEALLSAAEQYVDSVTRPAVFSESPLFAKIERQEPKEAEERDRAIRQNLAQAFATEEGLAAVRNTERFQKLMSRLEE